MNSDIRGGYFKTRFKKLGLHRASFYQSVVLIRKNRRTPKIFSLFRSHVSIGNDDDNITHLHTPRSRAIEANDPTAPLAADGVGLETLAVVVVDDLHFLPFHHIGGVQQIFINGDTTDVVQIGLRDPDAVYFAFKNFDEHGFLFLASENNQSPYSVAKVEPPDKANDESLTWQFSTKPRRSLLPAVARSAKEGVQLFNPPLIMKKNILFPLLALVCQSLSAQVMGNYGEQQQTYQNIAPSAQYRAVPKAAQFLNENQLEITLNTLSNQKASAYTAIFSITQAGKTADETNTLLNTRLNGFVSELKSINIPETDIYVDMVNFLPKYEYDVSKKLFSRKTYTEIPKGFQLQKNVHIRYTDPAVLERIVTAAAKQEIYDIVKVDYFVKNSGEVYAQLRDATFQYLKKIESQYKTLGIHLDSAYVVTAENAWVAYPINRYESYQAFSTQRLDIDESSKVNSADKITSRFYNAVPANDYDIVINPEILEPAVQFSYNLVVRFTLPERTPAQKTVVKKEFLLVTPNGEVKTLKIE